MAVGLVAVAPAHVGHGSAVSSALPAMSQAPIMSSEAFGANFQPMPRFNSVPRYEESPFTKLRSLMIVRCAPETPVSVSTFSAVQFALTVPKKARAGVRLYVARTANLPAPYRS